MDRKIIDDELIRILNLALEGIKDSYNYIKDEDGEDYEDIREDYLEVQELLEDLIPEIKNLDDLENLSDEDIGFIYEMIDTYAETFVIDHRNPELRKKQEEEYQVVQDLLDLFMDDDEEYEESVEE